MQILKHQIQIPKNHEFQHNHLCFKCNDYNNVGKLIWIEELESGVFVCEGCIDTFLINTETPLPDKTSFGSAMFCFKCKKRQHEGMVSFCPRCEEIEFICAMCHKSYFDNLRPNEFVRESLK